jgi:hypothetical protein
VDCNRYIGCWPPRCFSTIIHSSIGLFTPQLLSQSFLRSRRSTPFSASFHSHWQCQSFVLHPNLTASKRYEPTESNMKSAVILAILGAAAALPAPQGPPPAVVPTATIPTDTPMDNPMASGITMGGAKPTGASSIDPEDDPMDETSIAGSKPTGAFSKGGPDDETMGPSGISMGGAHPTGGFSMGGPKPPKGEKTWEGNHKTFDNGQWSQWATKTGGWHPDGERSGPGPTGWGKGKGKHHSGWATKTGGHHPNHPKQTPPMGGMGPTGPKSPTGSKPTMVPDSDDEKMSMLPVEPTEPAMVRRALDINYHLAPRHDDDQDDSPKGPGGPKNGDDDDDDAEKQRKEQEKAERKQQKQQSKDAKKHSTFNENPGFGKPTPTFGGGRPHGTGMAGGPDAEPTISLPGHREGRPTGTGNWGAKPTDGAFGGKPTDGAFGGKPSETVPEPSDVAGAVPPKGTGTAGKPQTRPSNPEGMDDPTEEVEPTPTMKL